MHTYKKVWVSETEYRIKQFRDDGSIRWVADNHAGYLQWLSVGNVPEEIPYVPPTTPPAEYPLVTLKRVKKLKIRDIRDVFLDLVFDEYDPAEIAVRTMTAVDNLRQNKAVGAKFTNMVSYLDPYVTWRNNKIQAVKACTTVDAVAAITTSYP